mgnify:FL=1
MFKRTYLRTLFNDILKNNFVAKMFVKIVNFYFDLGSNQSNFIKFQPNMPINHVEKKDPLFFQSVTGDKIDCK